MKASYVIKHYRFAALYRAVNKRWELKLSPGYTSLTPGYFHRKQKEERTKRTCAIFSSNDVNSCSPYFKEAYPLICSYSFC